MSYFDFTYQRMENSLNINVMDKIYKTNEIFQKYEENLINYFILGFKKNIFLVILKRNIIEIKDLRFEGMINNDISCCKIMKQERFFDNDSAMEKSKTENRKNENYVGYNDLYEISIFTGHIDGSLIKWEMNNNLFDKSEIYIFTYIFYSFTS